jgi:hypothetical protein|tara:strand:- start:1999 stop:2199 length:201 start_codon:yes stop_codon:yes gene_type:complete
MAKNYMTAAYAYKAYSDMGKRFAEWRSMWGDIWDSDDPGTSCTSLKRRKAKHEYYLRFPVSEKSND